MAARGLRGVRDDLSELGRHLLDIACFLHPLLNPTHTDSPPSTPTHARRARARSPSPRPATPPSPSPSLLAGILADLAEIGGSFRVGFSGRTLPDRQPPPTRSLPGADSPPHAAAASGVADGVLGAARALAARPDAWIDFPVLALDENSTISEIERDHMEVIEKLVPDLASLRANLCPSYMDEDVFWKIYFRLLESTLSEHNSEEDNQNVQGSVHLVNEIESPPHVCEIESEKSTQEGYQSSESHALTKTRSEQSIDQWVFAKSKSETSMDQWSEVPSDVESFREGKRYFSSEAEEMSDVDNSNVVVMDKYMDSLLPDRRSLPYAALFPAQLSRRNATIMDCRHGHALFVIPNFNGEVRVRPFDIFVLGSVPSPYSHAECFSAAVFCAAQGCDHHDCQGGHFFVAVVSTDPFRSVTSGWLYSSETRIWSRLTPVEHHPNVKCENHIAAPSVLVGDAIYFNVDHIIKCQLGTLQLSAFEKPTDEHGTLMAAEDGGLGFAAAVDRTDLTLWSRVTEPGGAMGWTKIRVVDLKILLPDPFSIRENKHECGIRSRLELVSGLAEGTQIIFLSTCFGSYIVDLKSGRATVSSYEGRFVLPYTRFYIPAMKAALHGPGAMS